MDTTLDRVTLTALNPALALLPPHMDSPRARVMLLTIGLQESRLEYRRQLGNGPARGLWQFERGTRASRGGVWGVYLHRDSTELLRVLATGRCSFDPGPIYDRLEHDDVLAAGVARLLLWTDPKPLPDLDDVDGAWSLYAERTWRPGKPHPETWPAFHARAVAYVTGAAA